jgi:hypothetical protein
LWSHWITLFLAYLRISWQKLEMTDALSKHHFAINKILTIFCAYR